MSSNKQITFLMLLGGFFVVPLVTITQASEPMSYAWLPVAGLILSFVYLFTEGE